MTTVVVPRVRTSASLRGRIRVPATVLLMGSATVLLRLPFLGAPLSPDEGGFLVVARQWHAGGGSLYGRYWVDRPPLLIATFQLADALGGLTALRLIAAFAAAVTVVAVGFTVNRLVGSRPAAWAAAVACALLVVPSAGGTDANGELFAAPYIAAGIAALVVALSTSDRVRARWAAAAAGACAVAAVLVKQNMLDVFVFAAAFGLLTWRSGHVEFPRLRRLAAPCAVGAAAPLVLVLGYAWTRGTSPGGVFYAMYPFRVKAAQVLAGRTDTAYVGRLMNLLETCLFTGGPLVLLALAYLLARRKITRSSRLARPFAGGLLALVAFAGVSIALGGNYWLHYLVQLAVPTALAAGLVVSSAPRLGLRLVALVTAVAAAGWAASLVFTTSAIGRDVGAALHRVSAPGDSVVSALGGGDVVLASGLKTPYTYIWSLPSRVLDPTMSDLTATLKGSRAPTWVVVRERNTFAELQANGPGAVLESRYRLVGQVCGRTVYLRADLQRRAPQGPAQCTAPYSTWFQDFPKIGGLP